MHTKEQRWTEFQLAQGEYDEIGRRLERDMALFGYVKDKIRCVPYGVIQILKTTIF
jgi:hypothetical protein